MEFNVELETTADGSATLYRGDMDEHYHSVKGALAESKHVYIDKGWRYVAERCHGHGKKEDEGRIKVFEVGFGTGLNAALTAREAQLCRCPTDYYSVELFPLSQDILTQYGESVPTQLKSFYKSVVDSPWNSTTEIDSYFNLTKLHSDFLNMELPTEIDVIYFDAFAPEKQPEMWQKPIFERLYNAMRPGAVLTTYCAKGVIRRMLSDVGFNVERLEGPVGGKREILRATRSRG